jgi:hypothetical protein
MNYLCRSLNATDASEEGIRYDKYQTIPRYIITYFSQVREILTVCSYTRTGTGTQVQLPFSFVSFGLKISSFTRRYLTNSFIRILQQQTSTRHNGYPSSSFRSSSYLRYVLGSCYFRKCIYCEGKYFCCTEFSSNESFSSIFTGRR